MIIQLYWWYLPLALLLFPFLWMLIRKGDGSGYFGDFYIDVILIGIVCWVSAVVSVITYWICKGG